MVPFPEIDFQKQYGWLGVPANFGGDFAKNRKPRSSFDKETNLDHPKRSSAEDCSILLHTTSPPPSFTMVSIVVAATGDKNKTYEVASQASLDRLLRQYHVHALLELNEYGCEITLHTSLSQGGKYTLGESLSSVELQALNNRAVRA